MDLHTYTVLACMHAHIHTDKLTMCHCAIKTQKLPAVSLLRPDSILTDRVCLLPEGYVTLDPGPSWKLLSREDNTTQQMAKYELGSTEVYRERGR